MTNLIHISSLLLGVIVLGGVLRSVGLDWDAGHFFHNDERVGVLEPAASLSAGNGLRPSFLGYGSLPIYLIRGLGEIAARLGLAHDGADMQSLKLIGRGVSALASTASIVMVYLLAARVMDRRAALLAAAFCAFAATLVQTAHIATVESLLTLWLLGAIYAAILILQEGSWKGYTLFGLFAGLGLATKASAVTVFAPLAAAHLIRIVLHRKDEPISATRTAVTVLVAVGILAALALLIDAGARAAVREWVPLIVAAMAAGVGSLVVAMGLRGASRWGRLFGAIAMAAGVAFIGWPWSVLGFHDQAWAPQPRGFLTSLLEPGAIVSGATDATWTEAFHGAVPFFYVLRQMFWWTLGPALGAVVIAGFGWAVWSAAGGRARRHWLVAAAWLLPLAPVLVFRVLRADPISYVPVPAWVRSLSLALAAGAWALALWASLRWRETEKHEISDLGEIARTRPFAWLVVLAWAFAYFLIIGWSKAMFVRYAVPMVPVLCVFGGAMLVAAWDRFRWRAARAGVAVVGGIAVAASAAYAIALVPIYVTPNTRVIATQWMAKHIPAGSRVLFEHWWNEDLPLPLAGAAPRFTTDLSALNAKYLGSAADGRLQVHLQELFDTGGRYVLNESKLDYLCEALATGDFIVLASNRHYTSVLAVPRRYPIASLYYRLLFSEQLGYRLVETVTSYPRLLGAAWVDDLAEDNFVNFDHPKVQVFVNKAHLSAAELKRRFLNPSPEALRLTRRDLLLMRARENE